MEIIRVKSLYLGKNRHVDSCLFFYYLTVANVWAYYEYMFKMVDEIRHDNEMNQKTFANAIGCVSRTYQRKVKGERAWLASEIILASQFNNGEIIVEIPEGRFKLKVQRESGD